MKAGDVCRIVKQPEKQIVRLVGKVGFIDEMNEHFASFQSLRLDGSTDGAGAVPLDCLVEETSADWLRAKQLHDEQMEKLFQEGMERGKRWQAKLEEVAQKNSLTRSQVEAIYIELRDFAEYMR